MINNDCFSSLVPCTVLSRPRRHTLNVGGNSDDNLHRQRGRVVLAVSEHFVSVGVGDHQGA